MARAKFLNSTNAVNTIMGEAIPRFAKAGFSGVSMRDIAKAVGISTATLYHHFPDKQTLYLRSIAHEFAKHSEKTLSILADKGSAEQRLTQLIAHFAQSMSQSDHFRVLIQRELLDGDESRLHILAEQIFQPSFVKMTELVKELNPNCDAHLMAISIASLVLFHLDTAPLRQFLPGGRAEHNNPDVIARHVTSLLLKGIKGDES